ncbi:hypothetical protein HZA75_02530 [Candidatus Roizmanbacteria bacterium]|nr:hypothetical protein [Candidatus Roizmanbacteria bacterium]
MERLENIPAIIWYYLSSIALPFNLVIQQRWVIPQITIKDFYLPLLGESLVFFALFFGGISLFKHVKTYFRLYMFFLAWFLLGLAMLLQIFPLDLTIADRWFYLPLVGFLGCLGILFKVFLSRFRGKVFGLLGVILILFFSLLTIARNANYSDEITLYIHDLQINEDAIMENDLGINYAKSGNMQVAFHYLQKSVQDDPYPGNLYNLALAYEQVGEIRKAKEYYVKAFNVSEAYFSINGIERRKGNENLAIYETNSAIYERLGWVLLRLEEYQNAEKNSKLGLRYYPESDVLLQQLKIAKSKLK